MTQAAGRRKVAEKMADATARGTRIVSNGGTSNGGTVPTLRNDLRERAILQIDLGEFGV